MSGFNNTVFFKWLWKHRIAIVVAQVVAISASIVFTSPRFMRPEYKSSAIIYPTNIISYTGESPTEQLIQFLNSVDIKDAVIKDFDLIKHYKIDTTKQYWYTSLLRDYDKEVEVAPTEYEAAEINVFDVSPDTAYLMVNDIIKMLNKHILSDQREKSKEMVQMIKIQLDKKKAVMDSLGAISKMLSVEYGLLDYPNQTREVEKAYYQALASGRGGKVLDEASNQIKNIEEKGEQYKEVNMNLQNVINDYDQILSKYQLELSNVNKQLTFTSIVAKPYPSDKVAYPIRLLYVLMASISVFIFSVILLKVMESIKQ